LTPRHENSRLATSVEFKDMNLQHALWVVLISMTPIGELRAGVPMAYLHYGFPWYSAFLLSLLGNLIPIPFILIFLDPLSRLLSKVKLFDRIFVGVPLPGTGAWTGSLIAFLLGTERKRAFFYIALGVLIADIIVTAVCVAGYQTYLWLK
jgi:uncharacterized membrane protein